MGSFVPSNVSICGILNFAERRKCSTPAVKGDSVCCTRASIETGARPFHRQGGLVFVMGHHDHFPSWMMIQDDNFPSWMMIRYSSHWVGDFLFLS